MISGFIFSFVYQARAVSFRAFSARRFARLYPLHFATLLIVAGLQLLLFLQISTTLFIPNNDPYHFFLNVFFASSWGFEDGLSFNGPIWSVSVEILVYICFWIFIACVPFRLIGALMMTLAFALMARYAILPLIALCGTMFFFGASVFFASQLLTTRGFLWASLGSAALAALLLTFVPAVAASGTLSLALTFGPVIAILAALDQVVGDRFRLVDIAAGIGDLSFSIYLLHFPLILVLVNGFILLGLDRALLSENPLALAGFLLTTLGFSHWSLTRFETRCGDNSNPAGEIRGQHSGRLANGRLATERQGLLQNLGPEPPRAIEFQRPMCQDAKRTGPTVRLNSKQRIFIGGIIAET